MADLEKVASDLNSASQSLQELREKYNGALDLLDNKNTEITGALYSAKSDALQEIQTISDTATSQISQLKDTSLNLVNEAKNTAIEEVNNAVSGIDTSKEEALLAIEQAKAAQEEKITDLEQAKENIITELSEKAKILTQKLEWTVGEGGKFTNLNDALSEALKYNKSNIITIKLKSGFIFNEKIVFSNANFNNVIISSEDDIVKVNPNNAVFSDTSVSYLFLSNYGITPIIDIKVDLNPLENSNSTKKIVFLGLYQNSRGFITSNKGCMNAVWDAIMVEQASTLLANACVVENSGYDGLFCNQGSIVSANGATIKGSARYGILTRLGGYVSANNAKLIDQVASSTYPLSTMLQCESGIIQAKGLITTGSTAKLSNITPNQITNSGIIYK
ncbi:hypothetical protein [Campylobacter jejuni]|uniref:hypothetical protein n=1 Tax=Campylobacter jejuni TaxID=197 RepID=UPI000F809769|nr:hypothetical protein [Campylobacter jejuni]RTJ71992.1 hypothetical protein C3H60_01275 [Campylobacter jejuni]